MSEDEQTSISTSLPAPENHNHYWRLVGKGRRWHSGHALVRCIRKGCSAWGVTGYQEGAPGPCKHAVGFDLVRAALVPIEFDNCPDCGWPQEPDTPCENCAAQEAADARS